MTRSDTAERGSAWSNATHPRLRCCPRSGYIDGATTVDFLSQRRELCGGQGTSPPPADDCTIVRRRIVRGTSIIVNPGQNEFEKTASAPAGRNGRDTDRIIGPILAGINEDIGVTDVGTALLHAGRTTRSKLLDPEAKMRSHNHILLVPKKGLEPSRPQAQDPKSCVSTNSTTSAAAGILPAHHGCEPQHNLRRSIPGINFRRFFILFWNQSPFASTLRRSGRK